MTYQDKLSKFTFLIPIFDLKDDRFNNFKFVLSKIKEVTDRVLVVEQVRDNQTTQSRQFTESLGIDYLPVKIVDDFIHKSKLINLGTDIINTDYVWVNDADCYLKFRKVIDLLDFRHNFIQPYNVGKYIEKEETYKIFKGEAVNIEFNYSKLHETGQHIVPGTLYYTAMYGALSFIYKKQAFIDIGKMNEMYTGWGLEDNSLCMRMFQHKNLKFDIVNLSGIHLYHPRGNYAKKLSCEKTKYNLSIYEEEFGRKINDLHALTRLYYENYFNSKRIAIIGVERSGTNMLLYALTKILKLTPHAEPFNISSTIDPNIPSFNSVDDYFNFYYKKNNFCLKHIHSEEENTDRFNLSKLDISEKIISNCDKIILTTRKNFMDWLTSFTLAYHEANWLGIPYSSNIIISREYFDALYSKWNLYHNIDLPYLIEMCKKYKKTYKVIDYDELLEPFGNFADLNIDLDYQAILHHTTIKRQKNKDNSHYIQNYNEVENWYKNNIYSSIFILTRFSLKAMDLDNHLNEEWLKKRLEMFELNFSSMCRQTYRNFKWLLLVDSKTLKFAIDKLNEYKNKLDQIEILFMDAPDAVWREPILLNIKEYIKDTIGEDNNIITVWHDSDDILMDENVLMDFAQQLNKCPPNTICGSSVHCAELHSNLPANINSPSVIVDLPNITSTCLALKSNILDLKTIFDEGHETWYQREDVKLIEMEPKKGRRQLKIISDTALVNIESTLEKLIKTNIYITDKETNHCYISNFYNMHFIIHKKSFKNVIEIGVLKGGSIKLWHDFFVNATIYGIDINLNNIQYNFNSNDRIKLIEGDINNNDILSKLPSCIDMIIDDGSHLLDDQINAFKKLFPLLKPGGIYVIEDIQNIDINKSLFLNLHPNAKIHDFRHIKNRYDDVIVEVVK